MEELETAAEPGQVSLDQLVTFIENGGIFMYCILACSVVGAFVIFHRFISLRGGAMMPKGVVDYIDRAKRSGRPEDLNGMAMEARNHGNSPLAVGVTTAYDHRDDDVDTMRSATEAAAREGVVKIQSGLSSMEVIITIAPLLGLLGTVSGLISVFGVFGESDAMADPDPAVIAAGIAEALYTTIGGLAVAVPIVIFHSFFNKRIERLAARTEVLLSDAVNAIQKNYVRKIDRPLEGDETAETPPPVTPVPGNPVVSTQPPPPRPSLEIGAR